MYRSYSQEQYCSSRRRKKNKEDGTALEILESATVVLAANKGKIRAMRTERDSEREAFLLGAATLRVAGIFSVDQVGDVNDVSTCSVQRLIEDAGSQERA